VPTLPSGYGSSTHDEQQNTEENIDFRRYCAKSLSIKNATAERKFNIKDGNDTTDKSRNQIQRLQINKLRPSKQTIVAPNDHFNLVTTTHSKHNSTSHKE
jgi:hypothetical protein